MYLLLHSDTCQSHHTSTRLPEHWQRAGVGNVVVAVVTGHHVGIGGRGGHGFTYVAGSVVELKGLLGDRGHNYYFNLSRFIENLTKESLKCMPCQCVNGLQHKPLSSIYPPLCLFFSPLFLQGTIPIGRWEDQEEAGSGGRRRDAAGGGRREGGVRRRRSEGVLSYTSLHKNYIVMPV